MTNLDLTLRPSSAGLHISKTRKRHLQQTIVAAFVVLSVFITNILVFGFTAVLPIYLVEFKNVFPEYHDLVYLVIFLPAGVFGIVGFMTGMFLSKFGVRTTGIMGSLFLTISIGAPSFSSSIYVLLGCFSLLPGIGCSALSMSANAGLAVYFGDGSRKFIASTTAGKALGYIIFPLLTNYFIEIMFWRGSLLLLAATFLQTLPCVFMFSTDMYKDTERKKLTDTECNSQKDLNKLSENISQGLYRRDNDTDENTTSSKLEIPKARNTSLNEKDDDNTNSTGGAVIDALQYDNESYVMNNTPQNKVHSFSIHENIINSNKNSIKSSDEEIDTENDNVPTIEKPDLKFSAKLRTVLTNFNFILFLLALFISYGCIVTASSILPDYCKTQGFNQSEGAGVFSVGSIGYVFACFVSSWLVHKNILPSKMIFSISAIICGILICIYPFLSTLTSLTTLTAIIMFTSGLAFSVYFVSVMDSFDIEYFSIAMGVGETAIGLGILSWGYLIGFFTEYMNTYEYSYYIIGIGPIVAAQPILISLFFKKLLNRNSVSYVVSNDNNKY